MLLDELCDCSGFPGKRKSGSIQIARPVCEQLFSRTVVLENNCSREQLFSRTVVIRSYDKSLNVMKLNGMYGILDAISYE